MIRVKMIVAPMVAILLLIAGCTDRQRDQVDDKADKVAGSAERRMDNATTTAAVKSKLAADVRLSTLTSINVDSSGSSVTLSGSVPATEDKQRAEEVARSVNGVTVVINNLEIKPKT